MTRFKVTRLAKQKARRALKLRKSLPKSKKFGLDKSKARRLGVASGVERAKQISRSKSLSLKDTKKVASFSRFLNRKRTPRVQGAIDLWGGEKFIRRAKKFVRKK